jgi:hypothetical protein
MIMMGSSAFVEHRRADHDSEHDLENDRLQAQLGDEAGCERSCEADRGHNRQARERDLHERTVLDAGAALLVLIDETLGAT